MHITPSNSLRGYVSPECEEVKLVCDGAVIMASGTTSIEDWLTDPDIIDFPLL